MKKTPFGACSLLRLCLILPAVLFSCAVKHTTGNIAKYTLIDTAESTWQIELVLVPAKSIANTQGEYLTLLLQPYNIERIGVIGKAQILRLSFRTHTPDQVSSLKDQLLATGAVEQVNITRDKLTPSW